MILIDLTHLIHEEMPVYPGTEKPKITMGCSIKSDGFLEKKMTLYSHTGTHMDAPAHMLEAGAFLDHLPVSHFFGKAVLITIESGQQEIPVTDLLKYEKRISDSDFVLIHTGWSKYWGAGPYFSGFPVLTENAANWLAQQNLKGIGVDTISVDPTDTSNYNNHQQFLRKGIVIIENLTNLAKIPCGDFYFSCFPLRIKESDGSPVRAIAYAEMTHDMSEAFQKTVP